MNIELIQSIIFAVWILPLVFAFMATMAYINSKFVKSDNSTDLLIIQITTIGNETVNTIINRIRAYNITIPYDIWVVSDEGDTTEYKNHDIHILVPDSFTCKAAYKARALEYAKQYRTKIGYTTSNIKLLLIDDDSIPSEKMINKSFTMPYDIANGICVPRNVLNKYTLVENIRTYSCTTICGVFQGILHFPIYIHGEGMCVRSNVEQDVGWNWHSLAEDLVFGHAAVNKGYKFGMLWADINVSPPLNLHDLIIQRRRWFWGIVHAVRYLLPLRAKVLIMFTDLFGVITFILSVVGIFLFGFKLIPNLDTIPQLLIYLSFSVWIIHYALVGYYVGNTSIKKGIAYSLITVLSIWYTAFSCFVLTLTSCVKKPTSFEVIEKKL